MKSVVNEIVNVDILVSATVPNMAQESLWKRPSLDKTFGFNFSVHRNSILPFHPVLTVNRYSTHRVIIYEVMNFDLAQKYL